MSRRIAVLFMVAVLAGCAEKPEGGSFSIRERESDYLVRYAAVSAGSRATLDQVVRQQARHAYDLLASGRAASDLAHLNAIGTTARIPIARDTLRLLDVAQRCAEGSGGAYDFTAAGLEILWGLGGAGASPHTPTVEALAVAHIGLGQHNVALLENSSASLLQSQTRVSVDPLIRAYAVDLAVVDLRAKQVNGVLVAGADAARGLGPDDAGRGWRVGLPDPAGTNEALGHVNLLPLPAIAWARLRERTVRIDDREYGAFIDPRSGRPASGTAMAAVLGPIASQCRALSIALVVAGLDGAATILDEFPKCELLVIPDRSPLEIWVTDGFRSQLEAAPGAPIHVIPKAHAVDPAK